MPLPKQDRTLWLADQLRQSRNQNSGPVLPPTSFIEFAQACGVHLSDGQKVLCSVAFDGAEPRDFTGDLGAVAGQLFGGVATIAPSARGVLAAVCGARGGKTYLLVALRLVYGMLTRDLSSLARGQRAVALVIAPNDKLRQEAINYALGAIANSPWREWLVLPKGATPDDIVSSFAIARPDGKRVTFEGGVATRGGYGGRGRSFTDAALDECAFFRDSTYAVSDQEVYRAVAARVLPGGQVILASTPWAKSGLLYDMFSANDNKHETAIAVRAPTLLLNPQEWVQEIVRREMARDADNANREYGAQFMTAGSLACFDPDLLQRNVVDWYKPEPGDVLKAGMDLGFRSDSSALCIVLLRKGIIYPVFSLELRPEEGKPLSPEQTIATFSGHLKEYGIPFAMGDGHYRETAQENLAKYGLGFIDAPTSPAEAYVRTRNLLKDDRLRLPNEPRLLQQAKEVQAVPLSGGGLSIHHPRWRSGGHGDLCAAWVLACYQLGGVTVPPPKPELGTAEYERQEQERRLKERSQKAKGDKWWRPAA